MRTVPEKSAKRRKHPSKYKEQLQPCATLRNLMFCHDFPRCSSACPPTVLSPLHLCTIEVEVGLVLRAAEKALCKEHEQSRSRVHGPCARKTRRADLHGPCAKNAETNSANERGRTLTIGKEHEPARVSRSAPTWGEVCAAPASLSWRFGRSPLGSIACSEPDGYPHTHAHGARAARFAISGGASHKHVFCPFLGQCLARTCVWGLTVEAVGCVEECLFSVCLFMLTASDDDYHRCAKGTSQF